MHGPAGSTSWLVAVTTFIVPRTRMRERQEEQAAQNKKRPPEKLIRLVVQGEPISSSATDQIAPDPPDPCPQFLRPCLHGALCFSPRRAPVSPLPMSRATTG